jgi:hypothetical protein
MSKDRTVESVGLLTSKLKALCLNISGAEAILRLVVALASQRKQQERI